MSLLKPLTFSNFAPTVRRGVVLCCVCCLNSLIMTGDKWMTSGRSRLKSRLRARRAAAQIGRPTRRNVQTTRLPLSQPNHPKHNRQKPGK